jgi:hypothetical protein
MRLVTLCLTMIFFMATDLCLAQAPFRAFIMPPKLKNFIDQTMHPSPSATNDFFISLNFGIQPEQLEFVTLASRFKTRLKMHAMTVAATQILTSHEMQKIFDFINQLESNSERQWIISKNTSSTTPIGSKKIILPPDWIIKTRSEKTRYIASFLILLANNKSILESDLDLLLALINDEEDIQHKINIVRANSDRTYNVNIDNRIEEPYRMLINTKFETQLELILISEKNPKIFFRYFVEFNFPIFNGPVCPVESAPGFNDLFSNSFYYTQFKTTAKNCFENFRNGKIPKIFWASSLHQRVFLCLE